MDKVPNPYGKYLLLETQPDVKKGLTKSGIFITEDIQRDKKSGEAVNLHTGKVVKVGTKCGNEVTIGDGIVYNPYDIEVKYEVEDVTYGLLLAEHVIAVV